MMILTSKESSETKQNNNVQHFSAWNCMDTSRVKTHTIAACWDGRKLFCWRNKLHQEK